MATASELATAIAAAQAKLTQTQAELADLTAQLIALAGQAGAGGGTAPGTQVPNATAGATLTVKSSTGKTTTTTGTMRLQVGSMVTFKNGRTTPVTATDDGITVTTREPSADDAAGIKALAGSSLLVNSVPGSSSSGGSTGQPSTGGSSGGNSGSTPDPVTPVDPAPGTNNTAALYLHGVNMSGLGNNPYVENAQEGTHYRAPQDAHFKKYADMGCRLVRLPVAAERFVTSDESPLADLYVKQVRAALDLSGKYNMQVIIDLHTYYRYWTKVAAGAAQRAGYELKTFNGVTKEWRPIGTDGCALSVAGYARLINLVVSAFKDHPAYLGVGLANEPHDRGEAGISVDKLWIRDVQKHVDAAAAASAKHWIFVGGCSYSSCRQWLQVSDALKNIKDVNDRVVFEGHNYLDKGTSGGGAWSNRNESIPVDNFINMTKPLVEWGQKNGKRVYIGEHGYPEGNASAEAATTKGLQYLTANNVMSTQWCAGPGWPSGDVLALDDDRGTFKTNVNAVKPFFQVKAS